MFLLVSETVQPCSLMHCCTLFFWTASQFDKEIVQQKQMKKHLCNSSHYRAVERKKCGGARPVLGPLCKSKLIKSFITFSIPRLGNDMLYLHFYIISIYQCYQLFRSRADLKESTLHSYLVSFTTIH